MTPTKTLSKAPQALSSEAVAQISEALHQLLADVFSLYVKTKSFHWHMTGRHFRDYHLLLDEQAGQIFAMTDDVAERARKIGGSTVRSVGDIARRQRLRDNDGENLTARMMLAQLKEDNAFLTGFLRETHELCARHNDVATTSMIEVWVDQAERRTWFLSEIASDI